MKLRLDKYLANMGLGTRSEVKKAITKGLAEVNGAVVKKPEGKVDTETDEIRYQGKTVGYISYEYYMLNDLFPVGRLDKDTEGLLLITNDGALAHRLLSPKKHVDKIYYARIQGVVTAADAESFAVGLDIGDEKRTLPAKLDILESGEISKIRVTVREGRFHQVKRMFQAVGKEVIYLKRLQMGSLKLDENLETGAYRELTKEEMEALC